MAYSTQYKALYFPLDVKKTRLLTWEEHPHLDELQDLVGGYIEPVKNRFAGCTLLVDEEGLLKENPTVNPISHSIAGVPLCGNLLLLLFPLE
jgi:hypothetical protein